MTRPDFGPIQAVSPDEAEELEKAWITGDAKERGAIEVAVELASRRLASNHEPLLSPPYGSVADGPIRLGRIVHGTRELGWLGISATELTQHLGVFGRSGSGKSTLALSVLTKLIDRQVPLVAFDHKRSARALKALNLPIHVVAMGRHIDAAMHFNPLVPLSGVPADAHIGQFVELLCQIFFAGEGVQSLLVRSITECWREQPNRGPPTLLEVRGHVESALVTQREALWKQSAMRILRAVTTGQMGRFFNTRRDAMGLHALLEHHTILELDGLTVNDSALLTAHILRFLTHALLAGSKREQLQLVCLIEEAHHLLGKRDNVRESPLETVLREAREIGLGCIIVDQTIGAISPVALANLFTTVVLNCKHRADTNAAARNGRKHYCLLRRPVSDGSEGSEYQVKRFPHWITDLKRYNIQPIIIDDYDEVTTVLQELRRRSGLRNIFISGAAQDYEPLGRERFDELCRQLGSALINDGYNLVSGYGLGVGGHVVVGALQTLKHNDDQRLQLWPFPQSVPDGMDRAAIWTRYRERMLGGVGVCIVLSGNKTDQSNSIVRSNGVLEEVAIARNNGAFILPVGATGYIAKEIWDATNKELGRTTDGLSEHWATVGDPISEIPDIVRSVIVIIKSLER